LAAARNAIEHGRQCGFCIQVTGMDKN